ncbi:MAG: uroporphyrinogen-III synthase [Bacteroidaceae bacterium]|nr:uroporphyrinogen-III synthase [Bacteroidaceae bacterium]MBO7267760.1 uroporphyrinogen-III synthase [Bacteroidaceae bacterium]
MKVSKILVSQPKPASDKSPYFDIARKYGVTIDFKQFIKVVGVTSKEFRQQKVTILDHTAIVFTSRHAIDHFFGLCAELRVAVPDGMKYFCVSETIALYIQKYVQYRKRKVFFGDNGKMDGLLPLMVKHKNEKYLVPLSNVHNDDISKMLDASNLQYTETVMYRTVSHIFEKGELDGYDMMIFFSPSGIVSLKENLPDFNQGDMLIACFGATTAAAIKDAGLRLDLEAPTVEAPSMTMALEQYLAKHNK